MRLSFKSPLVEAFSVPLFVVEDLCVFCALPAKTASEVVRLARRRRTTPEKLITRWVKEKLAASC